MSLDDARVAGAVTAEPKPAGEASAGHGTGRVGNEDPISQAVAEFQAGIDRERNFRLLFERFHQPVKNFFATRVSTEDAFDLTQETFVALYTGLDSFRGDSELSTWLFRIARNTRYQWFRRRRARQGVEHRNPGTDRRRQTARDVVDPQSSPGEQVEQEQNLRLLREALETLPEKMRECLRYRIYDELSYREIADRMGVSIQTVKAHLYQAREKLKKLLRRRFVGFDF
jgi:RNA polymerase sigma-70 factor (ECF subfamily)